MSLNFRDCHTKIRQVDSLETTNRSVVVQVIGELSNNGEPMRRFFQTFILAPRTPTHYYVRNDIFRYQDEVFVDDDEGYTEENCDDQSNHLTDNTTDTGDNTSTVLNSSLVNNNNQSQQKTGTEKLNGQLNETEKLNNDSERNKFSRMNPEISPINLVSSTGSATNELNNSSSEQSIDSKQSSINNDKQQIKDVFGEEPKVDAENLSPEANACDLKTATTVTSVLAQPSAPQEKKADENLPRTYATMVQKNNFGQLSNNTNSITTNNLDKNDNLVLGNNITGLIKKDEFANDWCFESAASTTTTATSNNETIHETVTNDKRNGRELSDEQQVFVGNLPQNIDENQLREYFIAYGDIVDVRICQKQGKTPNYGFITFNEALVVKKILSQKVRICIS